MIFTKIIFQSSREFAEILTAELAEQGFDTFEETEKGVDAYILTERFSLDSLKDVIENYSDFGSIQYKIETIEKKNWNEEWEKNYDPIEVEGKFRVRATFHEPDHSYKHEIVITPKMSFGTGHHATTQLILELQLEGDFQNKSVLDVGSGTGILTIMASKLGATHLEATDIDQWCVENGLENFALNSLPNVPFHKGVITAVDLSQDNYDIVIANINKNVLLEEIPSYSTLLKSGDKLYLSGFYESDIEDLKNAAANYNLSFDKSVIKDSWAVMLLTKN